MDYGSIQKNKGLVLRVVDEELLNLTSGIVQGMSGSPIIQDGKLIGAVTHVFINDPRGIWDLCGEYDFALRDVTKQIFGNSGQRRRNALPRNMLTLV